MSYTKSPDMNFLAITYLSQNKERFNDEEKIQFLTELQEFFTSKSSDYITDKVYDFFVWAKLDGAHFESRESIFKKYLDKKYSSKTHKNILDVGAGRLCKLTELLSKSGYNATAIDPNIKLTEKEAKQRNFKIMRQHFICDKYAGLCTTPTDIKPYNIIVAIELCLATEHIIHQSLKYDKPFGVSLCYEGHDALNGTKFSSPEQWYDYLKKISKEISIVKSNKLFVATNNTQKQYENEL